MAGALSQIASLFSIGTPSQIGIDIGSSSVKIVALKGSDNDPKIMGLAYEETPPGCLNDGILSDPRTVVNTIKSALERAHIQNYRGIPASVGIKGMGSVFRRLTLPIQSPEEMASQIIIEAQQQIESDLAEWIIDYQILTQPDSQGQVAVMLVGAKRHVANDYLQTLQLVGLRPSIFDCDIFAIANAFENANGGSTQETVLCLDIGRDSTKFHLLQDNVPLVVRSFQIGGMHLTDGIARALSVDYEQAEILKISSSNGDVMQRSAEDAVSKFTSELIHEMKQTIEFFANAHAEMKIDIIDRIVLSGGGARTRGLATALASQFNTHVEFSDPFRRARLKPDAASMVGDMAHIYSVAYGLALRRMGDREQ